MNGCTFFMHKLKVDAPCDASTSTILSVRFDYASSPAACAAAKRAIGTRKGEQDT